MTDRLEKETRKTNDKVKTINTRLKYTQDRLRGRCLAIPLDFGISGHLFSGLLRATICGDLVCYCMAHYVAGDIELLERDVLDSIQCDFLLYVCIKQVHFYP